MGANAKRRKDAKLAAKYRNMLDRPDRLVLVGPAQRFGEMVEARRAQGEQLPNREMRRGNSTRDWERRSGRSR